MNSVLIDITLKKQFFTFILVFIMFGFHCSTNKKLVNNGVPESISQSDLLREIDKTYPEYKSLKANFSIEGKIKKQDIYFWGELGISATKEIEIKVIEPVMKAVLFKFQWKKDALVYDNRLQNVVKKKLLTNYTQLFIFGKGIPNGLAFWPLCGLSHKLIHAKNSKFNGKRQSFQIKELNTDSLFIYEKTGKLRKASFRRGEKITIFEVGAHIEYKILNSKVRGYFYKDIMVHNNFSKDYIKITIKNIQATS